MVFGICKMWFVLDSLPKIQEESVSFWRKNAKFSIYNSSWSRVVICFALLCFCMRSIFHFPISSQTCSLFPTSLILSGQFFFGGHHHIILSFFFHFTWIKSFLKFFHSMGGVMELDTACLGSKFASHLLPLLALSFGCGCRCRCGEKIVATSNQIKSSRLPLCISLQLLLDSIGSSHELEGIALTTINIVVVVVFVSIFPLIFIINAHILMLL